MHPLAAPGTLWVLSRVGKYLVRPQADETSHKKQIPYGRQGKSLPCIFPFYGGFRLCGGDQGAFRSPPGPLRGPSLYAWAKPPTRNKLLAEGKKRPYLSFSRIAKDFASAEATKGLSGRPLETFGPLLRMGDSTKNRFLVAGRKRAFLAFPVSQKVSPLRRPPGGFPLAPWTPSGERALRIALFSNKTIRPAGTRRGAVPYAFSGGSPQTLSLPLPMLLA